MKRWRAIGSLAWIGVVVAITVSTQGVLAQKVITGQWGWVVARQIKTAAYTPGALDRGNSSGGVNTVNRTSKGNYVVHMPGISASGTALGVAHVSAMSSARRACIVGEWHAGGTEEVVYVRCFATNGAAADSRFTVNYLQASGVSGRLGYAWADRANYPGSYAASAHYQYDSMGGSITVDHTGTGRYRVTLPNLGAGAGVVLVSASSTPATCRFSSIAVSGPDKVVAVNCRNLAGALANTQFTITYLSGIGLKGPGYGHQAYVFAKHPTTTSYQPATTDRYSTSGQVPTIQRTGIGKYVVTLPGQNDGGAAQVTPETTGPARCVVNYIRDTSAPAQIGVGCYGGDGTGTDVPFTMEWAR